MWSASLLFLPLLGVAGSPGAPGTCYNPEDNGYSYRGLADFSISGRKCMKWSDQNEISLTEPGIGPHSYCRNPDESFDEPWCFVVGAGRRDVKKEVCNVDVCDAELRDFEEEADALKRYMGSRDCDCTSDDVFLLQSGKAGFMPSSNAKTTGGSQSSLHPGVDMITPAFVSKVEGLLRACNAAWSRSMAKKKGQESAAKKNTTIKVYLLEGAPHNVSFVAHQKSRRQCGLTEVLAPYCRCAKASAEPPRPLSSRAGTRARGGMMETKAKLSKVNTTKFQDTCSDACYSSSCSSCTTCTARCETGPHKFCNKKSKSEQWWAMCGITSHDQLMKGFKQCGDAPPTGCPVGGGSQ